MWNTTDGWREIFTKNTLKIMLEAARNWTLCEKPKKKLMREKIITKKKWMVSHKKVV